MCNGNILHPSYIATYDYLLKVLLLGKITTQTWLRVTAQPKKQKSFPLMHSRMVILIYSFFDIEDFSSYW